MDPENIPFETGDLPPELSDFFIQVIDCVSFFPRNNCMSISLQAYKAIAKDPSLVRKIQGIFQFRIKNSSDWIIDLKSGTGAVTRVSVLGSSLLLRNHPRACLPSGCCEKTRCHITV